MELSKRERVLYSLWAVPIAIAGLFVMLQLPSLVSDYFIYGYKTYKFSTYSVVFLVSNALIPLGFFLGWITSRAREDRIAFLVSFSAYFALATATFYFSPWDYALRAIATLLWCLEALVSSAYALRVRKALMVRAVLWRSDEQVERRRAASERKKATRQQARRNRAAAREQQDRELFEREQRKMGAATRSQQNKASTTPKAHSALAEAIGVTAAPSREVEQPGGQTTPMTPERSDPPQVLLDLTAPPAAAPAVVAPDVTPTAPDTVDVNACTVGDLLMLPGMTVSIAKGIVDKRDAQGPYQSLEQLVGRNDLKPHVVAGFITRLRIEAPPLTSSDGTGPHRARMLDL